MKKNPQMVDAWKKTLQIRPRLGYWFALQCDDHAAAPDDLCRGDLVPGRIEQGRNAALYGEEFRLMIEAGARLSIRRCPSISSRSRLMPGPKAALPGLWSANSRRVWPRRCPKTGMVVISDLVDDVTNIHPAYKKGVGDRLAGWALGEVYGKKDHKYRHATFRSAEFKRNQVIVAFDYAEGGLVCPDGAIADWRCAMPRCVSSRLRE